MARVTTVQKQLKGPINRDENLIAHSWFMTLVCGAIIGAIALLLWMFQLGAWSERRGSTVTQAPVVIEQQTPPPVTHESSAPTPSGELSAEELDRRHTEYLRRRD